MMTSFSRLYKKPLKFNYSLKKKKQIQILKMTKSYLTPNNNTIVQRPTGLCAIDDSQICKMSRAFFSQQKDYGSMVDKTFYKIKTKVAQSMKSWQTLDNSSFEGPTRHRPLYLNKCKDERPALNKFRNKKSLASFWQQNGIKSSLTKSCRPSDDSSSLSKTNLKKKKKYSLYLDQYKKSLLWQLLLLEKSSFSNKKHLSSLNIYTVFQLALLSKTERDKKVQKRLGSNTIKSFLTPNNSPFLSLRGVQSKDFDINWLNKLRNPFGLKTIVQLSEKKRKLVNGTNLLKKSEQNSDFYLDSIKNESQLDFLLEFLLKKKKKITLPWISSFNKKENIISSTKNSKHRNKIYKQSLFSFWLLPFFGFFSSVSHLFFQKGLSDERFLKNFIGPVTYNTTKPLKNRQQSETQKQNSLLLSVIDQEFLNESRKKENQRSLANSTSSKTTLIQNFVLQKAKTASIRKHLVEESLLFNLSNKSFLKNQSQNWLFFMNKVQKKIIEKKQNKKERIGLNILYSSDSQLNFVNMKKKQDVSDFLLFPKKLVLLSSKQKTTNSYWALSSQSSEKKKNNKTKSLVSFVQSELIQHGMQNRNFVNLQIENEALNKLDILMHRALLTQLIDKYKINTKPNFLYFINNKNEKTNKKEILKASLNLNVENKKSILSTKKTESHKIFQEISGNKTSYFSFLSETHKNESQLLLSGVQQDFINLVKNLNTFLLKHYASRYLNESQNLLLKNKIKNQIFKQKKPIFELHYVHQYIKNKEFFKKSFQLSGVQPNFVQNENRPLTKKKLPVFDYDHSQNNSSHNKNSKFSEALLNTLRKPISDGFDIHSNKETDVQHIIWNKKFKKLTKTFWTSDNSPFYLSLNRLASLAELDSKLRKNKCEDEGPEFKKFCKTKFLVSFVKSKLNPNIKTQHISETKNNKKQQERIKVKKRRFIFSSKQNNKTYKVTKKLFRKINSSDVRINFINSFPKTIQSFITNFSSVLQKPSILDKGERNNIYSTLRKTNSFSDTLNLRFYLLTHPYLLKKGNKTKDLLELKPFFLSGLSQYEDKLNSIFSSSVNQLEKQKILFLQTKKNSKKKNAKDLGLQSFENKTDLLYQQISPSLLIENRRFFVKSKNVNRTFPRFIWVNKNLLNTLHAKQVFPKLKGKAFLTTIVRWPTGLRKESILQSLENQQDNINQTKSVLTVLTKKSFLRRQIRKRKQLKIRLKYQQHRTRKKKKRRRKNPRPLWLRFNLYERFLKKRYSSSFFNAQRNSFGPWIKADSIIGSSKWQKAFYITNYYKNIPKGCLGFYVNSQKLTNTNKKAQPSRVQNVFISSESHKTKLSTNDPQDFVLLGTKSRVESFDKSELTDFFVKNTLLSSDGRQDFVGLLEKKDQLKRKTFRVRINKQIFDSNKSIEVWCDQTIPYYVLPIALPSSLLFSPTIENLSGNFIHKFLLWFHVPHSFPFPLSVFPRIESNRTILKSSWSLNKRNLCFNSLRSNNKKSSFLRRSSLRQIRLISAWLPSLQKSRAKYNQTEKIKKQLQKKLSHFFFSTLSNPVLTFIDSKTKLQTLDDQNNFGNLSDSSKAFINKFVRNKYLSNVSLKTFKNNEEKLSHLFIDSPIINRSFLTKSFLLKNKEMTDVRWLSIGTNVTTRGFRNVESELKYPLELSTIQELNNPFSYWWVMSTRRASTVIPFKNSLISFQVEKKNKMTKSSYLHIRSDAFNRLAELTACYKDKETSDNSPIYLNKSHFIVFLLLSSTFFHFCCLFSLITISQIRCVLKFFFLVFYKITGFFSIQIFYKNLKGIFSSFYFIPTFFNPFYNTIKSNLYLDNYMKFSYPHIRSDKETSKKQYISDYMSFYQYKPLSLKNLSGSFINNQPFLYFRLSPFTELFTKSLTKSSWPLYFLNKKTKKENEKKQKSLFGHQTDELNTNTNFFQIFNKKNQLTKSYWILDNSLKKNVSFNSFIIRGPIEISSLISITSRQYFFYNINNISRSLLVFSEKTYKTFKKFSFLFFFYLNCFVDFAESLFNLVFQFLKNPTEISLDLFALLFLVEWSFDMTPIIPDSFHTNFSNSFLKNIRVFYILGPFGLFVKKSFLNFFDVFIEIINEPDTDLLFRQKKGMLFFDQWLDFIIKIGSFKNDMTAIQRPTGFRPERPLLSTECLEVQSREKKKQTELDSFRILIESNFDKKILEDLQWVFYNDVFFDSTLFSTNSKKISNQYYLNNNRFVQKTKKKPTSVLWPIGLRPVIETSIPLSVGHKNNRWAVNQFITMQSLLQPELFVYHGYPRSFTTQNTVKSIRISDDSSFLGFLDFSNKKMDSFTSANIGHLIFKIYSGVFYKDVAKNVLVIGDKQTDKTLLIQAIAGETELSYITENANSYKLVINGVSVGLSLLKEVFEALPLHAPCLFLLEDIHVLGQRRAAFLVQDFSSDDDLFMNDNYAVHEKNQIYYTLSRHKFLSSRKSFPLISQKSSRLIKNKKKRQQEISHPLFLESSQNTKFNTLAIAPYSKKQTKKIIQNSHLYNFYMNEKHSLLNSDPSFYESRQLTSYVKQDIQKIQMNRPFLIESWSTKSSLTSDNSHFKNVTQCKKSSLEIQKPLVVVPPSTSPLNILILKEQKKMKPKKVVNEISWAGIPSEQLSRLSPFSYSIKIKVLMLVDTALENLYAKVNMITELLLMLDSVRSNKGFVVFATTHLPSILDPALRRPGRFDETIYLPVQTSKQINRWKFLKFTTGCSEFVCNSSTNFKVGTQLFNNELYNLMKIFEKKIKNKCDLSFLQNSNKKTNQSVYNSVDFMVTQNEGFYLINQLRPFYDIYRTSKISQKNFSNTSCKDKKELLSLSLNLCEDDGSLSERQEDLVNNKKKKNKKKILQLVDGQLNFLELMTNVGYSFRLFQSYQSFSSKISLAAYLHIIDLFSFIETSYQRVFFQKWKLQNIKAVQWSLNTKKETIFNKPNFLVTHNLLLSNNKSLQEPPSAPFSRITLPSRRFENYKRSQKNFQNKALFSIQDKIQMHQNKKKAQRLYAEDFNKSSNLTNSKHYNLENKKLNRLLFTKINNKIKTDPTSMNWYLQKKIIKRHSLHITNLWWTGQLPEHNKEVTFLSDIDWRILSRLKEKNEIVEKSNESQKKIKTNIMLTNSKKNIQEKDSKNSMSLFNYIIDFPDSEQYYNPKERRWMLSYGYSSFWFDIEMAGNNYSIDKLKPSLNFDIKKINKQKRTNSNKKNNYKTLSLLSSFYLNECENLDSLSERQQDFVKSSSKSEFSESFYNYHNIEKKDQQKYLLFYYFLNKNRELLDLFAYQLIEKGLIKEVFFIRHKIKI